PTTCKMRLVGSAQHRHPQQLLRLDFENTTPVNAQISRQIADAVIGSLGQCHVLCIEDYNKGVVTDEIRQGGIQAARLKGVPVIIDPAALSDYGKYRGCTCIKLNRIETAKATKMPVESAEQATAAGEKLIADLDLEAAVITLDKSGAMLCVRDE